MKAIVFGGSGFLGSHVADVLSERGHEVIIFDLRPSLYIKSDQTMILGDVLDISAVEEAVKGSSVVYNFAGVADIGEAKEKPLETVKANILGNSIILEACRKNSVQRFVFASSLYVYSDAGSFYRSSKQACELIIEDYQKQFGLNYTILRYGSLYGPRADDRNWIYSILKQAIVEGKITRKGSGEEIREYIHVLDAARMSVDVLSEAYKNTYVILTGNHSIKIKDLLIMIREMLGNKIEIEYLPADYDEHYEVTPYSFSPKIAKKIIGTSYLDMGQGILDMLSNIYREYHPLKKENGLYFED